MNKPTPTPTKHAPLTPATNKHAPIKKTASLITTTVISLISLTLLTGCTTMINKAWTHLPGQDKTEGGKYEIGTTGIRVMSDQYEKQVDEQLNSIKHQLINTAHEVVNITGVTVNRVQLSFKACTDQGHGPYRGEISFDYLKGRKEMFGPNIGKNFAQALIDYGGWHEDTSTFTHGSGFVKKNGFTVELPTDFQETPPRGGVGISTACMIDADLSAYYGKTIDNIAGEDITKEFNHH